MEHHLDITNAVAIPYFNFALFVVAFIVFFRKSLFKVAQDRRNKYLSASKEAQAALEAARATHKEVQTRLNSLDQELKDFRAQSESSAREDARRMTEETERFTKQLEEETKRLAAEAVERARLELRHEIVSAARDLAEKKISAELDSGVKERILKSRIAATSGMTVQ